MGSGHIIHVWTGRWLYDNGIRALLIRNQFIDLDLKVKDLINLPSRTCDRGKLQQLFYPEDVARILSKKTAVNEAGSKVWAHNHNGKYTVKSGYWLSCKINRKEIMFDAASELSLNVIKKEIWEVITAPKIRPSCGKQCQVLLVWLIRSLLVA